MSETEKRHHVCKMPIPDASSADQLNKIFDNEKAAFLDEYRWPPGGTIYIGFLEGDPELQSRVFAAARLWTQKYGGPANLNFIRADDENADIRISFVLGNGSWSHLGTYCKAVPKNEATMNFGWLTKESTDEEVRSVVLHEFGHAIGLVHEHQSPSSEIQWNEAAVIRDLSGPPNNWSADYIRANVIAKYTSKEIKEASPFDASSIMIYPIPSAWTNNTFTAEPNSSLSEKDIIKVKEYYN